MIAGSRAVHQQNQHNNEIMFGFPHLSILSQVALFQISYRTPPTSRSLGFPSLVGSFSLLRGSVTAAQQVQASQLSLHPSVLATSSWSLPSKTSRLGEDKDTDEVGKGKDPPQRTLRIGIIGGGIAGISVAHALTERLPRAYNNSYEIVVFEADQASRHGKDGNDAEAAAYPPQWLAATARNANSLVPAAAMHIFSKRSTLRQVAKDTAREWYQIGKDNISSPADVLEADQDKSWLFDNAPPYFAIHPLACVGPSATQEERMAFVRFSWYFLKAALWDGEQKTAERATKHCQLAKANRAMYLKAIEDGGDVLKQQVGHSQGFLAIYRSLASAKVSMSYATEHGEEASLLGWNEALHLEPELGNILVKQPLFVVQRPNDYTASCATFIRHWTQKVTDRGVHVHYGAVAHVEKVLMDEQSHYYPINGCRYRIVCDTTTGDNNPHQPEDTLFDVVVLAGGINTPLFAANLDIGDCCPTYPLRGFSLTVLADNNKMMNHQGGKNLLQQPFSFDNIYCTSVTPSMARLAGFGEFVGFRSKYSEGIPSIGQSVLSRYAHMYFPRCALQSSTVASNVQSCFRPLSPDDLPLAGAVKKAPGLFLHTGHGTFGWTTGLASGDCVAQDIVHSLIVPKNNKTATEGQAAAFDLADGSSIEKVSLSPERFR
jgi:glycine/D-amino acid oxidase-like deaminating enzyme